MLPFPTHLPPLSLGSLQVGARGAIASITLLPSHNPDLERRLIEMGFDAGAEVEILHQGFPKGDPIAVRVGGSTVALRRHEAKAILMEPHAAAS